MTAERIAEFNRVLKNKRSQFKATRTKMDKLDTIADRERYLELDRRSYMQSYEITVMIETARLLGLEVE